MAMHIERVPGKPIIIATLTDYVTSTVVQEMFQQSARLADEIGGHLYRITDVRETETSFGDTVMILAEATTRQQPGSPADPRFTGVLVGSHQWVKMFSESIKQEQYGKLNVPLFEEMEDAMAYIQQQIDNQI